MSASHLPQNVADWPSDPFAVLGVERLADGKSIRRAYTQLLRYYKPERLPQHFQRLRQAYENASSLAEWRERYRVELEADDEPHTVAKGEGGKTFDGRESADPDELVTPQSGNIAPGPAFQMPRTQAPVLSSELSAAWREAAEGRSVEAYQLLLQWHSLAREGKWDAQAWKGYAQLYWLLTLYPGLSPETSAIDWLVEGLKTTSAAWPLLELFRREVDRDPGEAFRPAVNDLLEGLPPQSLANMLVVRWEARHERGEHRLILSELDHFRQQVAMDHVAWGQLLITATERCVLEVPHHEPVMQNLLDELGSCSFSGQFGTRLDRLDLYQHVAEEWAELQNSNVPRSWLNLLHEYYFSSKSPRRKNLLQQITAGIAQAPLQALQDLDFTSHHFPAAAVLILDMLERYYFSCAYEAEHEEEWDVLAELPSRLLNILRERRSYDWVRTELVEWSLAEFVSPEVIAGLMQSVCPEYSEEVEKDRTYHCVYSAWTDYWNIRPRRHEASESGHER